MVVGKKGHCTLRIGWPPVNRVQHVAITRTGSSSHYEIACGTGTHFVQHVAITRTGSSSHYEIACGTGTHFVWVRFGNAGLSYDADDTKWVLLCQMGSESWHSVPNGIDL